jgi:small subunit ribosomal protein S13
MPRIVGVDIPHGKKIWVSLTYIHGIGRKTAYDILKSVGIDPEIRARELNQEDIQKITQLIDAQYVVEGGLRRQVSLNIQRLKDIACYRGLRHRRSLPLRGQRTRTNARTRKGRKKTVAVKRSVKSM